MKQTILKLERYVEPKKFDVIVGDGSKEAYGTYLPTIKYSVMYRATYSSNFAVSTTSTYTSTAVDYNGTMWITYGG